MKLLLRMHKIVYFLSKAEFPSSLHFNFAVVDRQKFMVGDGMKSLIKQRSGSVNKTDSKC